MNTLTYNGMVSICPGCEYKDDPNCWKLVSFCSPRAKNHYLEALKAYSIKAEKKCP